MELDELKYKLARERFGVEYPGDNDIVLVNAFVAGFDAACTQLLPEVARELERAVRNYPSFASAHEAYAVLLEEVDELWELVKVKQSKHDYAAMEAEAIQVAAMAARFIIDVCRKSRPV